MGQLRDLFISKTRVRLFEIFFSHPQKFFYVRELVRLSGEQINAVRRELNRLEKKNILKSEQRGNRLYYSLRQDYPFFADLLSMVAKTTGLGGEIIRNQRKIGKIKFASLATKFLLGLPRKENEVDLLVVGQVILPQLASLIRSEEARRKREINYTVMTLEEFDFRKRRHDPFILKILLNPRTMLIGDEVEMLKGLT